MTDSQISDSHKFLTPMINLQNILPKKRFASQYY